MASNDTEACGRCGLSSVVDATADGADAEDRTPFGDARIEVPEDELRRVALPQRLLGLAKRRPNAAVTRVTYGQ